MQAHAHLVCPFLYCQKCDPPAFRSSVNSDWISRFCLSVLDVHITEIDLIGSNKTVTAVQLKKAEPVLGYDNQHFTYRRQRFILYLFYF